VVGAAGEDQTLAKISLVPMTSPQDNNDSRLFNDMGARVLRVIRSCFDAV
jgi:hypothetical protein